jgi:hypothetical protein
LAVLWYWPNRAYVYDQQMLLGDWLPLLWALIWGAALYALSLPRRGRIANFWTAVLLAQAIASFWYLPRLDFIRRLSDVAFGTDRGNQDAWDPLNLAMYTRYPDFWVHEHMGLLAAALILPLAIGGWLLLLHRARRATMQSAGYIPPWWWQIWQSGPEPILVYWLLFAGAWLCLTLLAQANPRNLTPLVPIAAILLALSLRAFARPLAIGIAALWLAVLGVQWGMYTVNAGARVYAAAPGLWAAGDYLQFPSTGSTDPRYWIHPAVLETIGRPAGEADSLGVLVNTWEINRGAFRYLVAQEDGNLDIMTLTEDDNRGWSDALANRWLLVKDGDNRNVAAPGLAVIDGITHPEARGYHLFHQLYTPAAAYPLPDGDTVTLYSRAQGPRQPFAYPVILNETAPIAQNLDDWWSPGATVVFDSGDTAVWVGLHDLNADRVIIADENKPEAAAALHDQLGTVFVVARNHEAARSLAPANSYFARTVLSGSTSLDIYGRPASQLEPLPAAQPWSEVTITDLRSLPFVRRGEVLPVELTVAENVGHPLKLSLRLAAADGTVVAQNDVPADTGQDVRLGLFVPPATPAGEYKLEAVLYDPADLRPILDRNGEESAQLATATVTP